MTIEKHVVSLELAKQLKEAGYPQDGIFWWCGYYDTEDDEVIWNVKFSHGKPTAPRYVYPAPLASELGEELPAYIEQPQSNIAFRLNTLKRPDHWFVGYTNPEWCYLGKNKDGFVNAETESDARAKMWLYLKSEGLL